MELKNFNYQINLILSEFDSEKKSELITYFIALLENQLRDEKITKNKIDAFFILINLKVEEKKIHHLKNKYLQFLTRDIRKDILENIKFDYTKDFEIIFKPENWICRLIRKLNFLFEEERENIFLKNLNDVILIEIQKIFFSSTKFRTGGNMLLINLVFYERNFMKIEDSYYEKIKNNFHSNCYLNIDIIREKLN